ncbi:MAG: CNH domain-containing protein [Benjaminiella poitrasii]|nr:MAG: CNH domain-containing protein [Benjaminiella poitrasii]
MHRTSYFVNNKPLSYTIVSPLKQKDPIKPSFSVSKQNFRYYPGFLSSTAHEMKRRIILSDRIKNGVQYSNVFDGKEAVDKLKEVLGIKNRFLALRMGRALEAQRFFHEVNYENRLIDDIAELYQFNELLFHNIINHSSSTTSNSSTKTELTNSAFSSAIYMEEEDDERYHSTITTGTKEWIATNEQLPNGVYTELTYCYSPTCDSLHPCYSYTCPKKGNLDSNSKPKQTDTKETTAYGSEITKDQPLWSHFVDDYIVIATPLTERKRQETIFELIYTEQNFLQDLDYIIKVHKHLLMWLEPLKNSNIIPRHKRNRFINKVFSNIIEIRDISIKLTMALKSRQQEHPIVSQISDIMQLFVAQFEPFVHYGARQHEAKYIYEHERYNNPRFAMFAEQTERNVLSRKLELNGYLTKPTTRLGRYTLLLDKIYAYTISSNHPDKHQLPNVIDTIKNLLQRVNQAAGTAKMRFDLKQIHRHLTFKNKKDMINLRLLDSERTIVKQGILRKSTSLDSTEYQIVLFDHYLVIAKVSMVNATEHYCIQKRPIPIELLGISLPSIADNTNVQRKRSTRALFSSPSPSSLSHTTPLNNKISPYQSVIIDQSNLAFPIQLYHQGKTLEDIYMLYAPNEPNRKAWHEVIQKQRDLKLVNRPPVFNVVDRVKRYEFFAEIKAHHMVIFDESRQYLLGTDSGLYLGSIYNDASNNTVIPRKILPLDKVHQVHILEEYQLLLILADQVLWQYPLDIIINGVDGSSIQHFGRKIRTNAPFFHVGTCLGRTLICVPRKSTSSAVNGTEIDLYEPTMPKMTEKKKSSLFKGLMRLSTNQLSFVNTQVTHLKPIYSPCDVWAIDNTPSILLLTTPLGIIAVDMKTKKPDALLDPSDKHLLFITKNEKIDEQMKLNPVVKRIAVFQVPNGDYLICYDKHAFYIDKKGRRTQQHFMIEWEGHPTAFAYHHPHIIAFEHQFIEIRSALNGCLEQVIQEKNIHCLENGHKSKAPYILGTMLDKTNAIYQHIFELKPNV